MELFEKANIGNCTLPNRIIRSATFEGMCDENGIPGDEYASFYEKLGQQQIGAIITGFAFISKDGRAMQPGQAGLDTPDKIPHFQKMTERVHECKGRIFIQLAHTGRQSRSAVTGSPLVSSSRKRSAYFREKPEKLDEKGIQRIARQFGDSAYYAKEAGFDGVQVHAAHGYLVHQFILGAINSRKDEFGIDKKERIGKSFLKLVVDNIRKKCGDDYPLLLKISCGDDYWGGLREGEFVNLIRFIDTLKIDAIEISYGTMDYAMNIFRGDFPTELILKYNPFYKHRSGWSKNVARLLYFPYHKKQLKKFAPCYNQDYAVLAKKYTGTPIISVGGYRTKSEMSEAISGQGIDFVSLCRPFVAEPDLVSQLKTHKQYISKCCNCNYCAVMCDSDFSTKCYKN